MEQSLMEQERARLLLQHAPQLLGHLPPVIYTLYTYRHVGTIFGLGGQNQNPLSFLPWPLPSLLFPSTTFSFHSLPAFRSPITPLASLSPVPSFPLPSLSLWGAVSPGPNTERQQEEVYELSELFLQVVRNCLLQSSGRKCFTFIFLTFSNFFF